MNRPQFNFGNSQKKTESKTYGIDQIPEEVTPQAAVVAFLKQQDYGNVYEITLQNYSIQEAENFLHRMRVELSRMRNKLRQKGYTPKPFKMLKHGIVRRDKTTVVLQLKLGNKGKVDMATALQCIALEKGND